MYLCKPTQPAHMNYLSAENLSKSYGEKTLFENISFGLNKGDKTALIANNGTGKTTLLRILSGKEATDTGSFVFRSGIKVAALEQEPELDSQLTLDEMVATTNSSVMKAIRNYEKAVDDQSQDQNKDTQQAMEKAATAMDHLQAWDYERRLKQLLDLFRITNTAQNIGSLSGGERKRLALALILLDEPDLLILDEPTNHLDIDMIEWLEKYLSQSKLSILMVTHDRYFLDRICDHIIEMNAGQLFHHQGNYAYFLEKREERESLQRTETDKARQLMKKELEWLRRQPKARTTKSKARIDAFDHIEEKAKSIPIEASLKLQIKTRRLGGKILELKDIEKQYDGQAIISKFSFMFKKGERVGIIGPNGSGKTTLLNLISGAESLDAGSIETGETVVFGYYQQNGISLDQDQRVIDLVKDIAEVVEMGDGRKMTASQFLGHFMFPPQSQHKYVSKLSGGELRRLHLLTVLIKSPNFLILDEPTNDLDLLALNKLEEFLLHYKGCLILVSHDRYFLDKLTDHLFVFEGNGKIKDHYGSYTKYKAAKEKLKEVPKEVKKKEIVKPKKAAIKTKLSFNEKREFEQLEKDIQSLEDEKSQLEQDLNSGNHDYEALNNLSSRIAEIIKTLDEKTLRWMELAEYVQ